MIKSNEINLRQENQGKLKGDQKIIILIKKNFFFLWKSNNTDNFLRGLIKDKNEQITGKMGIHCWHRSNKSHRSICGKLHSRLFENLDAKTEF